jgi:DNA-binding NarL/FixJ family response regulator
MDCGPVLIVEDDPSARELLSCVLAGAGYETTVVSTGEAALVSAGEERPALVVLDVQLPGVSGYEVCRQLRERFGQQLPIVFVSGTRTEPDDRVAGLLIGADDYIAKPFSPDELVARVHRLFVRTSDEPKESDRLERRPILTRREHEVLSLLAEGLSQEAIAAELYISPNTVATHIQRVLHKLGVHSRAAAVSRAFQLGLVTPDFAAHLFA